MNADPENFEQLQKLLALKRHEQPPPRYFNELPNKIWSRIETEQGQSSFWKRIFPGVVLRPAVAYAFGLIVCGTLIVGIGSALKQPETSQSPAALVTKEDSLPPLAPIAPALAKENTSDSQGHVSSTNPVINVVPVSFSTP